MELINKTAIVTGAAGGIGQAIIHKLLEQGAKVLAVDISPQSLNVYQDFDAEQLRTFVADVTEYQEVEAMVKHAAEQFGSLDIMINNAGIGAPKPLLDHDQLPILSRSQRSTKMVSTTAFLPLDDNSKHKAHRV